MRVGAGDNNDGNLSDGPIGALRVTKCPAIHYGHPEIEEDRSGAATRSEVG